MTKDQSILQAIALTLAQIFVLLAISPAIVGLISKVKARLQCRQGASIVQPYADLRKLFRKEPVVSTTTSWIFTATPYIVFASTVTAGLLVPIFASQMPLNFAGNIIAFVYLLALGIPFVCFETWKARPGNLLAPYHWRMSLPWLADILSGLVYYFAGMLMAQRAARWYGSRGLALRRAG